MEIKGFFPFSPAGKPLASMKEKVDWQKDFHPAGVQGLWPATQNKC
jgi:hypothetical protein